MAAALRLGLAGAGRWGRNYIRTIASLGDVHLAGVASRNPQTPALVPPGCRIFSDWQGLVDASLDAIIVATPPASHAEIARAAILKGIPVLIEKPLALSAADARAVRDLAVERNVLVVVEHTHLFSPAFRALKKLAASHGGVREIHSEAGSQGPYRHDVSVLWDWGPHDVAMCLELMQQAPAAAACTVRSRAEREGGVAETISIALSFPSGVPAQIVLSNCTDRKRRFTVRCAGAELIYDDLAADKLLLDGAPVVVEKDLPLTVAVREFAASIRAGRKQPSSLDLGVSVVEVLEACAPR